jgi:hypothetical protein
LKKAKEGLAKRWSGRKIGKKAHAGRGQETQWEMSHEIPILSLLEKFGVAAGIDGKLRHQPYGCSGGGRRRRSFGSGP